MDRPRQFLACLLLAATAAVAAQDVQPLQPIRDAAISALQVDASAQAMVAPGLRLPACPPPFTASPRTPPVGAGPGPATPGGRRLVPRLCSINQWRGRAAEENPALAVMVKRGDPVVLRASLGGTEVRMGGKALGQARAGGILNVENDSSHRIIRGRLAADGTVEVVN